VKLDPRSLGSACAMEHCVCPYGRGYFTTYHENWWWSPSIDRFPIAGKDGGRYEIGNVRLAHFYCNTTNGGMIGDRKLKARSGRKAACSTHYIQRSKPCICGQHEESA
jgi:hypothetical protein